jgi:''Cold-shock'' DNA-binding domain.
MDLLPVMMEMIFFHESGLTEGIYVREGDKVEFKVIDGDRGQKAVEISIID